MHHYAAGVGEGDGVHTAGLTPCSDTMLVGDSGSMHVCGRLTWWMLPGGYSERRVLHRGVRRLIHGCRDLLEWR